jgi:hypothetical protein
VEVLNIKNSSWKDQKVKEKENVHNSNYVIKFQLKKIIIIFFIKMLPWEYFACKWKVNKEKKKREEKKKWGSKKMFTNPIMLFIKKKLKSQLYF